MNKRIALILLAVIVSACATEATTKGTAWGAGIGALVGGVAGGHGSDAVMGAAVGAGIGYLIGNEQDKSKAQKMSDETRSNNYVHNETGPLGGTRWRLQDWSPKDDKADFRSKTIEFGRNGWVKTTTTYNDGRINSDSESYRVINSTLIVNKGDYLVNYKFSLEGDQLTVDNSTLRALLKRM